MLIGIRSSAIKGITVTQGKLKLCKEHGFTAVELSFNYEPDEFNWQDAGNAVTVRQQGDQLGLGFTAHGPDHLDLAHLDKSRVAHDTEELQQILHGISLYGASCATFHIEGSALRMDPSLTAEDYRTKMAHVIMALQAAESACKKNRIKLLVETMTPGSRLTASYENILKIMESLQSPWIGICLDVNHLNLSNDVPQAIRKGADNIQQFHCSDNFGEKEEHRMLGDGIIDWDAVARAAAEIDFDGNLILETNTYGDKPYSSFLEIASAAAHKLADKIVTYGVH